MGCTASLPSGVNEAMVIGDTGVAKKLGCQSLVGSFGEQGKSILLAHAQGLLNGGFLCFAFSCLGWGFEIARWRGCGDV